MRIHFRIAFYVLVVLSYAVPGPALSVVNGTKQDPVAGEQSSGSFVVATSQRLKPVGEQVEFFGRPTDLALSPDESILAVKTSHGLVFIDCQTHKVRQVLLLDRFGFQYPHQLGGSSFTGLAWDSAGLGVWTTDAFGGVHLATMQSDRVFQWTQNVHLPGVGEPENIRSLDPMTKMADGNPPPFVASAPGGVAFDEHEKYLYVTLSGNNSLGAVNLARRAFEYEVPVGVAPYSVVIRGNLAYVTNWGGRRPKESEPRGTSAGTPILIDPATGIASSGTVSIVDLTKKEVLTEVAVGLHPSALCISHDGRRLYVANTNSDTVSVIETVTNQVVQTLSLKRDKSAPFGSMPDALAISRDDSKLYVGNGGDNTVVVYDLRQDRQAGEIPVGWFPSSIALSGKRPELYVTNLKGFGSLAADRKFPLSVKTTRKSGKNSYDWAGSVTIAPLLKDGLGVQGNRQTVDERIWDGKPPATQGRPVPIPAAEGQPSVFRHVLYIIKENHSYDEILGDLKKANGDPSLCMFCGRIAPNHHALAEEFVTFDNFYVNGVLSADGHQWTDEGLATDYVEKSMGGFPRSYPSDGSDPLAYSSSGFIWNAVLRKGLTFRDYGEFLTEVNFEPSGATWSDFYQDYLSGTHKNRFQQHTEVKSLEPYISASYPTFALTIPDVYRAREFLKEFDEFTKNGQLPNLIVMSLPNDHTAGTNEGFPTPRAMFADNDMALGRIVEAVSHSKYWKDTVIFVVEDDAQSGLDHVDGRRTAAFAISAYTRRNSVDHTFYNQNSILRSIELIFGLPPLTKFDLLARPLWAAFQQSPDLRPYTAKSNGVDLTEMNPKVASLRGKRRFWAEKSMAMDFSAPDRADDDTLNHILWYSTKGYSTPYPGLEGKEDDDD